MGLFDAIDTSSSGLTAERLRMDVIANNIANVNTTRTPEGGPYRRQQVIFEPRESPRFSIPFVGRDRKLEPGKGVRVVAIQEDESPPRLEYRPGHPDADENGYVRLPNVNIVVEMTDMITATRAYEANVQVITSAKDMMMRALRIGH
ncbi:MAG: flagellar basal body rod protein FlgC [bacterium]|nr:flagellar basal body rod protein FlgC [bacterium]